jgi:multidrug resistance efflux pump
MPTNKILIAALILTAAACNKTQQTTPVRKNIVDAVFASGNIITKNQYAVTANSEGFLKDALVSEGDSVTHGQLLFHVFNDVQHSQVANAAINYDYAKIKADASAPQIQQYKIQISQAKQQAATDSINFARYQRLIKTKAVAQADYDKAQLQYQNDEASVQELEKQLEDLQTNLALNKENAKSQLTIQQQTDQYNSVFAVAPGRVLNVYKKVGDFVKKGEAIATIGTGYLIIKLQITEDDIDRVKLGQDVLVSLNTEKDTVYKAVISKVYPYFDDVNQSFIAEATFLQLPPVLKSNTQLQANIVVGEKKGALIIPTLYLDKDGMVTLKNGNKRVAVKTGIRNVEWTEILGGLSETDVIVMPKTK